MRGSSWRWWWTITSAVVVIAAVVTLSPRSVPAARTAVPRPAAQPTHAHLAQAAGAAFCERARAKAARLRQQRFKPDHILEHSCRNLFWRWREADVAEVERNRNPRLRRYDGGGGDLR